MLKAFRNNETIKSTYCHQLMAYRYSEIFVLFSSSISRFDERRKKKNNMFAKALKTDRSFKCLHFLDEHLQLITHCLMPIVKINNT